MKKKPTLTKAAFLKLPMRERRRILKRQASDPALIEYYRQLVKENPELCPTTPATAMIEREKVIPLAKAVARAREDFAILICRGDLCDEPRAHETLNQMKAAFDHARTLGIDFLVCHNNL